MFILKYRKRLMYGRSKVDIGKIIKRLCDYIEIIEGAVWADYVHLYLGIPLNKKSIRCGRIHKRQKRINDTG